MAHHPVALASPHRDTTPVLLTKKVGAGRVKEPPEETGAENGDAKQSAKQRYCFNTGAAFALPIYVAEVEPKREFIQGQSGANPVEGRHDTADPNPTAVLSRGRPDNPEKANQQK